MVKVGDLAGFKDANGVIKPALVQFVHSEKYINVIVISNDSKRDDSYGKQIEHETSVPMKEEYNIAGRHFWEIEQPK